MVVMIGLLTAFQVDRWWEGRLDRITEDSYLLRLISEIEEDIPKLEYAISLAEVRMGFGDLLAEVAADPTVAQAQSGLFLVAVAQAAFTYTPVLVAYTFEDLRSTGNIKLIRNTEIKRALQEYYGFDQNQRQFVDLNFMIEFRYFELSADILSLEQYRFVQERWFVVNREKLEEVEEARPEMGGVIEAAERLSEDKDLIAWLPKTRGLQFEQIAIIRMRLENARYLLENLKTYRADLK